MTFSLNAADSSWHTCLKNALAQMDPDYLQQLYNNHDWLPGAENIFNAFSLPVNQTQYILFGESPYPRKTSANGYAFWDAAVGSLWSETGLSKPVNRATSLRNILKMLLVTAGRLSPAETSQTAIAQLNKKDLIQTNTEFFQNFLAHGFLLLNATPVLRPNQVKQDARAWQPFVEYVLDFIFTQRPQVKLVLFGNIANLIDKLVKQADVAKLYAEHPYNLSFIHNQQVQDFFRPLHLLKK